FLDPAAHAWARITVESRIMTSRSGSRSVAAIAANRLDLAQRSKRRHWLFQFPSRSGRSRHGAPVRAIHSTELINRRLSWANPPGLSRPARQQVLDPVPIGIRNLVATKHARPSLAKRMPAFYPN